MTATQVLPDHPAKWSGAVLDAIATVAQRELGSLTTVPHVLDPFAGVGLPALADALAPVCPVSLAGVELQPEWASALLPTARPTPAPIVGDATQLPDAWTGTFDAVVTSPCYGNRMADHHDAADRCKACGGSGCTAVGCLGAHPDDGRDHRLCPRCKGEGLSWRNTYAHALRRAGAEPVKGSAAVVQWGPAYRRLHLAALGEMFRVLVPGGLLVVNMSNHVREGQEQLVVEWWVNQVLVAYCRLVEVVRVQTPRQRNGANGDVRVENEVLIVARTPVQRRLV